MTWTVNLGTIISNGKDVATYTALLDVPGSALITATSSEDTTKSGSVTLIATRAPPSGSWQHTGPPGGGIISVLAEDPSSPNIIYATGKNNGPGGLFKSVDSGKTWTAFITNSALDQAGGEDIAVVDGGQVIYDCGGSFYVSIDGGNTWSSSQLPSGSSAGGMAVDPKDYLTIYISYPGQGILKSQDGGTTWSLLGSSPVITSGSPTAVLHNPIEVDPTNTNTIYYGTDHGLYISNDGGNTWAVSATGIATYDTAIRDVAVDTAAPSSIFLLAGISGSTVVDLYTSIDGGNSWTALATGLDAERVVPDPNTSSIIYLYGLVSHAAYKSIDGGKSFVAADAGTPTAGSSGGSGGAIGLSGPTGTMIPLAASPGAFLLTIGGAGIYGTDNAAQTWTAQDEGLSAWNGNVLAVDPENAATIYFGALNGGGIFRSNDAGVTWTNILSGVSVTSIAVDPFDSNHLLAVSLEQGLSESDDQGNTWNNVNSSLPTPTTLTYITGITFHPTQEGTIFIETAIGGLGLLRSTDGGATYSEVNTGLTSTDIAGCMAVSPTNPQTLLIADGVGLATSVDGGNTWSETTSGITCPFSVDARSSPPTIYAADLDNVNSPVGAKSTDFGKTWTTLNTGPILVADPSTANSVFYLANASGWNGQSYTTSDVGSWSPDAGVTWYPLLSDGLGDTVLDLGGTGISSAISGRGLLIAPSSPQVMFAASWSNSLLRFVVGP